MTAAAPARLDDALAWLAREHGVGVRACAPLAGGRVNHSWRLDTADGACVLRLAAGRDADLGVDRHGEYVALQAAAAAGLAPAIVACDATRGLLLTRWVEPGAWTRDQARSPAAIVAIARWFAALHRVPAPHDCREVDQAATVSAYALRVGPDDLRLAGQVRAAAAARAALGPPTVTVLCHNDLHHLNIVGSVQRPLAVDWEYAGRGDGRVDLGQFALVHDLDAAQCTALLAAYDGPAGPLSLPALDAAMRLAAAVNRAWAAVVAPGAR